MAMILESADRSQRFPLDRESIFIGSSEWKSDICLAGPDIADVHCELTLDELGVRVVALVDRGVTVNGQTVREASLSTGDELGIALLRFRLTVESDGSSDSSSGQLAAGAESVAPHLSRWLVRMSGMNFGPLDWDELETMIGRGEVRLDDEVQRENEATWQPLRDVLPRAGGDGFLCDDEPVDDVPRRRRSDQTSANKNQASDQTESQTENSVDAVQVANDDPAEMVVPLAPQFFIRRGDEDVGPLPRQALQELADAGSVLANTLVRLEDAKKWSTAAAVGFHCQTAEPAGPPATATAGTKAKHRATGILWIVFAPYYFVSGVAATIEKMDPRRAAKWGAALVVAGVLAFGWLRSWSQTAMRGIVTLDGQPVSEVLVHLTGTRTGESAMGVSDRNGNFRVVTLDGELKPGLYLLTVRPISEVSGNRVPNTSETDSSTSESNLPERYRHLNTTDATIEITAEQAHYSVALTTKPRSKSSGFSTGISPAPHSLP
jgi:hypothetical protein